MDFWRTVEILGKRKWLILLSMVATVLLTFIASQLIGSRWLATVRLVSPASSPLTGTPSGPLGTESTGGDIQQTTRTQAAIYAALVKSRDVIEPALAKLSATPPPVDLLDNIEFEMTGPRLFELHVYDSDPARAAEIANTLAQVFVEKNRDLNGQQAERAVKVLEEQLRKTKTLLADTRKRYDAYRRRHGVVTELRDHLGPTLQRLEFARSNRDYAAEKLAESRARLQQLQTELTVLPTVIPVERAPNESPLVQELETALARAESELTTLQARFHDGAIEVRQAKLTRDTIKARLQEALGSQPTAMTQPNPARASLQQTIREVKREIAGYEAQLTALNTSVSSAEMAVKQFTGADGPLGALASEIADHSQAQANLDARLQAAQMALDVAQRQNPIVIMDPVNEFNPPINMTAGRTKKLLVLAALCALLGTAGLLIALDGVDRRLRTISDAERAIPAPIVAAIPQPLGPVTAGAMARATEFQPLSLHSEAYRFLGLHLLNSRRCRVRSLMAVSAKADQGNTDTVTNLAITLAQAGQKVILVDANIRQPRLHEVFGVENDFGLTDLLQDPGSASIERALQTTSQTNVSVITSGTSAINPWELFRSQNVEALSLRLRDLADYVLYDTPSALAFTDALNLAPAVEAAFLCVRALEPLSGAEQRLIQLLEDAGVTVLGSVLNNVPSSVLDSYQHYQHYYPAASNLTTVAAGVRSNGVMPSVPKHASVRWWEKNGKAPGSNGQNGGDPDAA